MRVGTGTGDHRIYPALVKAHSNVAQENQSCSLSMDHSKKRICRIAKSRTGIMINAECGTVCMSLLGLGKDKNSWTISLPSINFQLSKR